LRMIRYPHTYQSVESDEEVMHSRPGCTGLRANTLTDQRAETSPRNRAGEANRSHDSGRPTPFDTPTTRETAGSRDASYRAIRELPDDKRELLVLTRFTIFRNAQVGRFSGARQAP